MMSIKVLALAGAVGLCLSVPLASNQAAATPLSSITTDDRYSIDGSGNNVTSPDWGSAGSRLLRLGGANYSDGISEMSETGRPNVRAVSNSVAAQTGDMPNQQGLSNFFWVWGQFLDHDISITPGNASDPATIKMPQWDPQFDPAGTDDKVMPFSRSVTDPTSGTGTDNPREHLNKITAFIDGSNVYGSDEERANFLRTHEGGKMKVSDGNLLPFNSATDPVENDGGSRTDFFVAGDIRANENAALTSLHTLFVREHNRLADEIGAASPGLSDEEIYQRARSIVVAEIQSITYNEFLPLLLGEGATGNYGGYDATVNPGIATEFSTAAYRFGHSMLPPELTRLDGDGYSIPAGVLALRDAFFNPGRIEEAGGIEPYLQGLAAQYAQNVDHIVIDDVRNFLFGPPGSGGLDLVALNLQRGRDHGLPGYNDMRVVLGLDPLDPLTWFESDVFRDGTGSLLASIYGEGGLGSLDLWIAGLAETPVAGGLLGPTFTSILLDQFLRLREGDRFWYENIFGAREVALLESFRLSDIIRWNTGISNLQEFVFLTEWMDIPAPPMAILFIGSLLIFYCRKGITAGPV